MKQIFNVILTALTIAMLALLTFAKLNEIGGWVDLTKYQDVINIVSSYGPRVLVCFFAFVRRANAIPSFKTRTELSGGEKVFCYLTTPTMIIAIILMLYFTAQYVKLV